MFYMVRTFVSFFLVSAGCETHPNDTLWLCIFAIAPSNPVNLVLAQKPQARREAEAKHSQPLSARAYCDLVLTAVYKPITLTSFHYIY